jgi:hypothetical protein
MFHFMQTLMNGRTVFFVLTFFCLSSIGFAQKKDSVFLINGSIIIGELKGLSYGKIEIDGDGIGIVKIKYNKVRTIQTKSNLYKLSTTRKELLFGVIESSDTSGMILFRSDKGVKHLRLEDISSLAYYGKRWNTKLTGIVGLGYSYTKSSDIGRMNFNTSEKYFSRKFEAILDASMIVTKESTKTYRERENLDISCNFLLDNSWYASTVAGYQRNIQLGLLRRFREGGGVGYRLIQNQKNAANISSGFVINQEKSFSGVSTNNIEWLLTGNYHFFSFNKPEISFSTTQSMFTSLTQKGRIRFDGELNVTWVIITDFSFNLNFYHNYDRKSPGTNQARTDFGYLVGLNYKF